MNKKLLISGAAVVLFVVFLVVSIPARFALQFITLPAGVQLGGVEGTLWRGQLNALRVDDLWLREISWRIAPARLLTGSVQMRIEISDHVDNVLVGHGEVIASANRMRVRDTHLSARLTDLAEYAPQPSPFPLRGDVVLHLAEFEWGQPACTQVQGRVELVGGAFQVGQQWEALGELNAQLSCDDGWLNAQLTQNSLGLTAFLRTDLAYASGEYQISPSPDAPRSVRNLVAMLPESARRAQRFTVAF